MDNLPIVQELEEKTGAKVFAFLDPCYGACDIAGERANALGAGLLLHFGHEKFVAKEAIETVYLPLEYEIGEKKIAVLAAESERAEAAMGVLLVVPLPYHVRRSILQIFS